MPEQSRPLHEPPRLATWILGILLKDPLHETPLGDFEEFYNWTADEKGKLYASVWYWGQVINLFRKMILFSFERSIEMFKSYMKTALRNMFRHKAFTLINIFGLSIGISVCLIIFNYVRNDFTYDRSHENGDRIYRLLREVKRPNRPVRKVSSVACPTKELFERIYPEVESVTRIIEEGIILKHENNFFDQKMFYVDPEFFKIFSHDIIAGDRENPLADMNSVVLTESLADKFFPDRDPIGSEIEIDLNYDKLVGHVTAVVEDPPDRSSFNYELFIPFPKIREMWGEDFYENFGANSPEMYIMLKEKIEVNDLRNKLDLAAAEILKEYSSDVTLDLYLQPLTDIHLESEIPQNVAQTSNPVYSYILSLLGALLLLLACVNYILLSVGRSTERAREIGVRKVLGAFKLQLIKQYLGEAMLVSLMALLLGVFMAYMLLPTFNELSGKDLRLEFEWGYLLFGILVVLSAGFLAGSYPALMLSSFKPVNALKRSLKIGVNNVMGKGLILLQFSITIFLLTTAFLMRNQLDYLLNRDLGYDTSHIAVLNLQLGGADNSDEFYALVKNEMSNINNVLGVTGQSQAFGNNWTRIGFRDENTNSIVDFTISTVDYDYLRVMGIELVDGRDFSKEHGSDIEKSIIVNRAFADFFGFDDPLTAKLPVEKYNDRNIIGVIENYNFLSLHNEVKPICLQLKEDVMVFGSLMGWGSFPVSFNYAMIKLGSENLFETVKRIETKWKEIAADKKFELSFLEDDIQVQYELEHKWGKMINITTVLAFLVGCLGLLGLASITVERRIKEVSIRKVLGASVLKITGLLTADLVKLVLISNLIAVPLVIFTANNWLENFAYRTPISITAFLLSGVLTLVLAVLTISFHSIRAALSNPAQSLRTE